MYVKFQISTPKIFSKITVIIVELFAFIRPIENSNFFLNYSLGASRSKSNLHVKFKDSTSNYFRVIMILERSEIISPF